MVAHGRCKALAVSLFRCVHEDGSTQCATGYLQPFGAANVGNLANPGPMLHHSLPICLRLLVFTPMSSPPASLPSDPEVLLELARQDIAEGQLAAAHEKCLRVLSMYHHHPGALEVLGTALNSQGRHEDAVRVFNALTLMEPQVAGHWQNLGTVLRQARRYAQSLAAFERALRLGPVSPELLYNLGVLQMDRCDYRAAYLALRDGVALAPNDATIRWAFAQCCYDIARREEALESLEDWQQLEGLTVEITVLLILLLVMMAAVDPAQPVIQQLLANPPQKGAPRSAVRAFWSACIASMRRARCSRGSSSTTAERNPIPKG